VVPASIRYCYQRSSSWCRVLCFYFGKWKILTARWFASSVGAWWYYLRFLSPRLLSWYHFFDDDVSLFCLARQQTFAPLSDWLWSVPTCTSWQPLHSTTYHDSSRMTSQAGNYCAYKLEFCVPLIVSSADSGGDYPFVAFKQQTWHCQPTLACREDSAATWFPRAWNVCWFCRRDCAACCCLWLRRVAVNSFETFDLSYLFYHWMKNSEIFWSR